MRPTRCARRACYTRQQHCSRARLHAQVGHFTQDLGNALTNIVVETDRAKGYGDLLAACKVACAVPRPRGPPTERRVCGAQAIATGTCYLLILVYGARVKAIIIKAKQCKEAVAKLRSQCAKDQPEQETVTAVQDCTTEMGYLAALVNARIKEVTDEDEQKTLLGHSNAISGSRQESINTVNGWLQAPGDEGKHSACGTHCDDLDKIIDEVRRWRGVSVARSRIVCCSSCSLTCNPRRR